MIFLQKKNNKKQGHVQNKVTVFNIENRTSQKQHESSVTGDNIQTSSDALRTKATKGEEERWRGKCGRRSSTFTFILFFCKTTPF